jgi:hypothetical protein
LERSCWRGPVGEVLLETSAKPLSAPSRGERMTRGAKSPRLAILLALLALLARGALVSVPCSAFGGSSSSITCITRLSSQVARPNRLTLFSNRDNDDSGNTDTRRNLLGSELRGLQSAGMKSTMEPGDTVVAKRDIPSLGIFENASYELVSVYAQRFLVETQQMEKLPLASLDEAVPAGHDRYVTLYSAKYHDGKGPVVVTPEEAGLVTVRKEIVAALWLALPGFFWIFVALSFANYYHARTGGNFFDAFWGR